MTSIRTEQTELELEVIDCVEAAHDVVAVRLAASDRGELPRWTAGAHIDLVLGENIVRQYSLCGELADTETWRIAVLRTPDSRGGSKAVHALNIGDRITARGPRNNFPLVEAAHYIFIAGGIGITPILPMIQQVGQTTSTWELHYGGRQHASMAFAGELAALGGTVSIVPQDELGILDLASILRQAPPDAAIYTCGPEPLLNAVTAQCAESRSGALHLERFSAVQAANPTADTEFEVVLSQSQRVLTVPGDKSIFETLFDAGVNVVGSCLEGLCGTCETTVLSGDVDHRDTVLSESERQANETMMICVSRCRSGSLTLDL